MYGTPRVDKKVLGKIKDELHGEVMREMVGLISNMYLPLTWKEMNIAIKS